MLIISHEDPPWHINCTLIGSQLDLAYFHKTFINYFALYFNFKMELASSKKSRSDKRKRSKINKRLATRALPSTLTTMAATPSVSPSTPTQEITTKIPTQEITTKIYLIPFSPSTSAQMGPSTSNIIGLSTPPVARSTPIPEICESTRFMKWAYSKAQFAAIPVPGVGEMRFVKWSRSISRMADPNEPRRKVLKWAHSTSTIRAPDECKRWSLQEEISKPFETALKCLQEEIRKNEIAVRHGHLEDEDSCTDLKQEHMLYTCKKGVHGVYECQNALWIWQRLRNSSAITLRPINGGPREVGKKNKEKFPESDMIEGRPSINDGYVTIELSGKWIAVSIHKMVKTDIDTRYGHQNFLWKG